MKLEIPDMENQKEEKKESFTGRWRRRKKPNEYILYFKQEGDKK